MRSEGKTLEEIGKHFSLSRQRIKQIEQSAEMHEEILQLWGFPFSVRTFNTLERLCIKSREEALQLYNTGHLRPGAVRGFGWVSYHEICEWLEYRQPGSQSTSSFAPIAAKRSKHLPAACCCRGLVVPGARIGRQTRINSKQL
jgi:hypothetical protein